LKWALTILAIKLFLSEGFTLEALQKLHKPEPKLPIHQLPTNQSAYFSSISTLKLRPTACDVSKLAEIYWF
jgi:hypothetical protein